MSRFLVFTAASAIGPSQGFRMGTTKLVAGTANSTATIQDGGTTAIVFAALANAESPPFTPLDGMVGVTFSGQASVSGITAGATLVVEEL